eukprot:6453466-Alexandrium_andersonii.AAC.1
MASSHSWERDWEQAEFASAAGDAEDGSESEVDVDFLDGADAGSMFMESLLDLFFSGGRVSAKNVCVLAWWASRAGALGPASQFGLRPSS